MPTLAIRLDPTAVDVRAGDTLLHVTLADGRELAAPLEWFPRLRDASPEQRSHWRLIGRGQGVHWPDIDEDISVASLLRLAPAGTPGDVFRTVRLIGRPAGRTALPKISSVLFASEMCSEFLGLAAFLIASKAVEVSSDGKVLFIIE